MDELNMWEWIDQHVPGIPEDVKTFLDQTMSGWYGLDMAWPLAEWLSQGG